MKSRLYINIERAKLQLDRPGMGKGGWVHPDHEGLQEFTWDEISKHSDRSDKWIVIDDYVYDVTKWAKRHPGGEKIISGYAGHDASVN